MSCFDIEKWVDFVRHAMPAEQMTEMQRHLDMRCPGCTTDLRVWQCLLDLATKEASYEPPEDVLRIAKAVFAQHMPRKANSIAPTIATLIFDSFRQPRPVGIRASRRPLPQQLLYAAGAYLVDVRVEGGPTRLALVGQILNSAKPGEAIKNVPIALLIGDQPVAKAVSSAFGEFEFEFEFQPGKDLHLAIGVQGENSISISLRDIKPPARRVSGPWQRSLRPYIFSGRDPFREH